MGRSVRLLLAIVLVAVVTAAKNQTAAALQKKKEGQTQSVITIAWGIFGFFVFTSLVNVTGILYDRRVGSNKVADAPA